MSNKGLGWFIAAAGLFGAAVFGRKITGGRNGASIEDEQPKLTDNADSASNTAPAENKTAVPESAPKPSVKPAPQTQTAQRSVYPHKAAEVTLSPAAELPEITIRGLFNGSADGTLCADCTCKGKPASFYLTADGVCRETRRPADITGAARLEGCTLFINKKGAYFVYDDPERSSYFCEISDPIRAASWNGRFYIYSDSLLYICTFEGDIEKTVSLCAMLDIPEAEICDSEEFGDSFIGFSVAVKTSCFFENGFAAAVTEQGGAYLADLQDDFLSFDKAYGGVIDMCAGNGYAYFLAEQTDENGSGFSIIKTRTGSDGCETVSRSRLNTDGSSPVRIILTEFGLAILFDDSSIKLYCAFAGNESEEEKAFARAVVRDITAGVAETLGALTPENIFPCNGGMIIQCMDHLFRADISVFPRR